MSDKFIKQLNEANITDPSKVFVPVQSSSGTGRISLKNISDLNKNFISLGDGEILYTTYDNKPISLNTTDENIKNEYNENGGYGIIKINSTKVPDNLIKNQNNLKTISVSGSFKTIGNGSISSNYNLQEINLESGITTLGDAAFEHNKTLASIYLPDTITTIGPWALCGNDNLQSVKLPKGLKELSEGLFDVDTALLTVNIPDSVTKIGDYVFEECSSLFSLNIPNSVTSIGEGVFNSCINLQVLNLGGIKGTLSNFLVGCSSIKEVILPEGITSIASNFCSRTNLNLLVIPSTCTESKQGFWEATCKKVDLRSNVTKIGYSADTNPGFFVLPVAKELEELILRRTTGVILGVDTYLSSKGTASLGYNGIPLSKLKIYVPKTLLEDYKKAYPTLVHRFFPISGEQDVYAYQDETYTRTVIDNKLENFDGGSGVDEETITELKQADNDLLSLIVKLHATISMSLSATSIFMNTSTNININSSAVFDGKDLTRTLLVDGEPLSNPYNILLTQTNANSGTASRTFNVVMNINNVDPKLEYTTSRTLTVTAYYPRFFGIIDKEEIDATDFTNLSQQALSSSASISNKTISTSTGGYLWLCVPSNMTINNMTSGGFAVPIESPKTILYNFNGSSNNYKCYRSTARINAGSITFSLS